jgi:hypothetical protein
VCALYYNYIIRTTCLLIYNNYYWRRSSFEWLVGQFSLTITIIPTDRDILGFEFSLEQVLEISQN